MWLHGPARALIQSMGGRAGVPDPKDNGHNMTVASYFLSSILSCRCILLVENLSWKKQSCHGCPQLKTQPPGKSIRRPLSSYHLHMEEYFLARLCKSCRIERIIVHERVTTLQIFESHGLCICTIHGCERIIRFYIYFSQISELSIIQYVYTKEREEEINIICCKWRTHRLLVGGDVHGRERMTSARKKLNKWRKRQQRGEREKLGSSTFFAGKPTDNCRALDGCDSFFFCF